MIHNIEKVIEQTPDIHYQIYKYINKNNNI